MKIEILLSIIISFIYLNTFGQSADYWLEQGKQQVYEGNYTKGIKYYNKALSIKPDFAEGYYYRANAKYDLKKYEEAIIDCKKALSLNPKLKNAHFNLALSEYELKEYQGAILNFTKAIMIDKDDAEAFYWRAKAYLALNQKQRACKDWKEAKKLGNHYAEKALYEYCLEENQAEY